MKKLKIGIIGCGGIARGAHVPYFLDDKRVEVVAVCDILPNRAQAFVEAFFPQAVTFTDYAELLKCANVDAIDICTPNYLHSEVAVAAFAVGKHVFCEKPDAVSPEKAQAMKDASEKAGKVLMVMRNNRFSPQSQYAKKYIEDGKMGEVYAGRCGWLRQRGIPGKGGWFTTKAESGGGPLIDLGVHMIDLAIWLMGNPRPVSVSGATYCKFADQTTIKDSPDADFGDAKSDGTFDVEDLAMGFIRFENGAVLQVECSWASNVEKNDQFVELRGDKAGLTWRAGLQLHTEEYGMITNIVPKLPMGDNVQDNGHYRNLKDFTDVILNGAEPCFKPQQGVDMIKILSAFYESSKTGREVVL